VKDREPSFPLGVGDVEPVLQGPPQRRQFVCQISPVTLFEGAVGVC
jgi:hypothetical protein